MTHSDAKLWAQEQFGQVQLKDPRRTQRFISLVTSIVNQPGVSVARLPFSPADMEGAYPFIRNENIDAKELELSTYIRRYFLHQQAKPLSV